jgi:hypothetical protein
LKSDDQRHAFFESFRNLRSSLFYLPVEGERPKAFLITSSLPNEGKSTGIRQFGHSHRALRREDPTGRW